MKILFDAAVQVTSAWALSAFIAAVVLTIVYSSRKKAQNQPVPTLAWFVLVVAIVTPSLGGLVVLFVPDPLYRLRITVRDPDGRIQSDAKVSVVPFGVQKQVGNAWEFEISKATVSGTGAVVISAESSDGLMLGKEQLTLGKDSKVDVTVTLVLPRDAHISGIVIDNVGRAVAGARVSVVGFDEFDTTDEQGTFDLNAHAAKAQPVQLHTEAKGFLPDNQTYLAGSRANVTLQPAPPVRPPPRRR